jgi:xanthine dehydrogenase YagT iron-sulfur-binding subunit
MANSPKSKSNRSVSRRKFLKTAGALGGATAASLLVKRSPGLADTRKPAANGKLKTPALGPGKVTVTLDVNGRKRTAKVLPSETLLDTLRGQLKLTGPKRICDHGECGACTVLMDGRPVASCMTLAVDAVGKKILTIEGLASGEKLDPIQQAFIDHDSFQCGFCTSGMIMSLKGLMLKHPKPSAKQIKAAVAGNYCRCGALPNILKAAKAVANA